MTVEANNPISGPFIGNGLTTRFPRSFSISDASHVVVILNGVVEVSGYTVLDPDEVSGDVEFNIAPDQGVEIFLTRSTPIRQDTDYSAQGAVSPEQIESDIDYRTRVEQENKRDIERSVRLPIGQSGGELSLIPADHIPVGDGQGNLVDGGPIVTERVVFSGSSRDLDFFLDRQSAEAAEIDDSYNAILVAGSVFVRDPQGTAIVTFDGSRWTPKGQAYLSHWGAVQDDDTPEVKLANAQALRNALNATQHLIIDTDGPFHITTTTPFLLRRGQTIQGFGMPTTAQNGVDDGGSKLIIDGSGPAAFASRNPAISLIQFSLSNLAIRVDGPFEHILDLQDMIGCNLAFLDLEGTDMNINGIRANKAQPVSWRNDINTVRIRIPTGSLGRPWDVGFGDSDIYALTLGGGTGSFDRSTGNNNYQGGLWNNSSDAAMTFTGQQGVGLNGLMTGVVVEENLGVDIRINADNNTDLSLNAYMRIANCTFRSNVSAIELINETGSVRRGINIVGNNFTGSVQRAIDYDPSKWDSLRIEGNSYRNVDQDRINQGRGLLNNVTINGAGSIEFISSRMRVGTFNASISDDLNTITGGSDGDTLILQTITDGTRVITLRDGVGNLSLSGDCILTNRADKITLMYDQETGLWHELSRSIK